uniref:Uncharacterized protein n=1 Tax=Oryza sativa subsp. japonica TaxID=39947 RepID=Q84TS9_ORYSJ|nr:hypothetical protein [Oryza sativa Japonica Group]
MVGCEHMVLKVVLMTIKDQFTSYCCETLTVPTTSQRGQRLYLLVLSRFPPLQCRGGITGHGNMCGIVSCGYSVCVPRLIPGRGFYAQISSEIISEFLGMTAASAGYGDGQAALGSDGGGGGSASHGAWTGRGGVVALARREPPAPRPTHHFPRRPRRLRHHATRLPLLHLHARYETAGGAPAGPHPSQEEARDQA